jgi:DNA-directed RNA polymerase subunit RPC12/RpoP
MSQPQTCFSCGKSAPETDTSYTLISSAHGWRVSREKDENGENVARWRCADCWKKFKETRVGDSTPSPSSRRR